MSKTPRPTPLPAPDRSGESRSRRSATHDYWPRDFWDAAPDTGSDVRSSVGDWASI